MKSDQINHPIPRVTEEAISRLQTQLIVSFRRTRSLNSFHSVRFGAVRMPSCECDTMIVYHFVYEDS